MTERKAFLKQIIAIEKQSLSAHQRELELIENVKPKQKQDKKNERVAKYEQRIAAGAADQS
jgi:hypothetical protein